MSELRDTILAAIDGGARDRAAIIEATGLEHQQVSNLLFNLKASGAIVKNDEGYARIDSTTPPLRRRTHDAVEQPPETAQPRARKATKLRKANGASVPVPVAVNRTSVAPVAFARFGEYVVVRMEDLAELVATLDRWRSIADLARAE